MTAAAASKKMAARAGLDKQPGGAVFIEAEQDWRNKVEAASGPVLVLFTSRFCAACKRTEAMLPAVRAKARKNVTIAIVDVEKSERSISQRALGPLAFIPVFQIYSGGDRKDDFMGEDEVMIGEKLRTAMLGEKSLKADASKEAQCSGAASACCTAFLQTLFARGMPGVVDH